MRNLHGLRAATRALTRGHTYAIIQAAIASAVILTIIPGPPFTLAPAFAIERPEARTCLAEVLRGLQALGGSASAPFRRFDRDHPRERWVSRQQGYATSTTHGRRDIADFFPALAKALATEAPGAIRYAEWEKRSRENQTLIAAPELASFKNHLLTYLHSLGAWKHPAGELAFVRWASLRLEAHYGSGPELARLIVLGADVETLVQRELYPAYVREGRIAPSPWSARTYATIGNPYARIVILPLALLASGFVSGIRTGVQIGTWPDLFRQFTQSATAIPQEKAKQLGDALVGPLSTQARANMTELAALQDAEWVMRGLSIEELQALNGEVLPATVSLDTRRKLEVFRKAQEIWLRFLNREGGILMNTSLIGRYKWFNELEYAKTAGFQALTLNGIYYQHLDAIRTMEAELHPLEEELRLEEPRPRGPPSNRSARILELRARLKDRRESLDFTLDGLCEVLAQWQFHDLLHPEATRKWRNDPTQGPYLARAYETVKAAFHLDRMLAKHRRIASTMLHDLYLAVGGEEPSARAPAEPAAPVIHPNPPGAPPPQKTPQQAKARSPDPARTSLAENGTRKDPHPR